MTQYVICELCDYSVTPAWVYVGTLSDANSKADKLLYTSNIDSTSEDSDGENRNDQSRKCLKPAKLRKECDVEES